MRYDAVLPLHRLPARGNYDVQGEKFIAGREIFRAKQGYCALALFPHHAAILRREAQDGRDRVDCRHQDCLCAERR